MGRKPSAEYHPPGVSASSWLEVCIYRNSRQCHTVVEESYFMENLSARQ